MLFASLLRGVFFQEAFAALALTSGLGPSCGWKHALLRHDIPKTALEQTSSYENSASYPHKHDITGLDGLANCMIHG